MEQLRSVWWWLWGRSRKSERAGGDEPAKKRRRVVVEGFETTQVEVDLVQDGPRVDAGEESTEQFFKRMSAQFLSDASDQVVEVLDEEQEEQHLIKSKSKKKKKKKSKKKKHKQSKKKKKHQSNSGSKKRKREEEEQQQGQQYYGSPFRQQEQRMYSPLTEFSRPSPNVMDRSVVMLMPTARPRGRPSVLSASARTERERKNAQMRSNERRKSLEREDTIRRLKDMKRSSGPGHVDFKKYRRSVFEMLRSRSSQQQQVRVREQQQQSVFSLQSAIESNRARLLEQGILADNSAFRFFPSVTSFDLSGPSTTDTAREGAEFPIPHGVDEKRPQEDDDDEVRVLGDESTNSIEDGDVDNDDEDDDEEEEEIIGPNGEILTEDEETAINNSWDDEADPNEILASNGTVTLDRSQLFCLEDGQWLNDEVINFILETLNARVKADGVHIWNTHFYVKLCNHGEQDAKKDYTYANVRRWTKRKKIDIFSLKRIVVPIHEGIHWALALIDMENKRFVYYDSLFTDNAECLDILSRWVQDESMDKKGKPFDLEDWSFEYPKDIPGQKNGYDCGVFMCEYARTVGLGRPIDFSQRNIPYVRRKILLDILSAK